MQRHDMIEAMRGLGLKGMAGAFDDAVTTGLQRQRTTMEILTDLLRAEATHRHAASIRYRMAAARLPVVKDIDAFRFEGTPINEGLVRSLHSGAFLPALSPREIAVQMRPKTGHLPEGDHKAIFYSGFVVKSL